MAQIDIADDGRTRTGKDERATPPAPRVRVALNTVDDVKRELGKLYRETKAGKRDVGDASKLANMLAILGRMIGDADLERRIAALEAQGEDDGQTKSA